MEVDTDSRYWQAAHPCPVFANETGKPRCAPYSSAERNPSARSSGAGARFGGAGGVCQPSLREVPSSNPFRDIEAGAGFRGVSGGAAGYGWQ